MFDTVLDSFQALLCVSIPRSIALHNRPVGLLYVCILDKESGVTLHERGLCNVCICSQYGLVCNACCRVASLCSGGYAAGIYAAYSPTVVNLACSTWVLWFDSGLCAVTPVASGLSHLEGICVSLPAWCGASLAGTGLWR